MEVRGSSCDGSVNGIGKILECRYGAGGFEIYQDLPRSMADTGLNYFIKDVCLPVCVRVQIKTDVSLKQNNKIHFDSPSGNELLATFAAWAKQNQHPRRPLC